MSTRLFVSAPLGNGVKLELRGEQARYLGRVLRARAGDTVSVFNGDDGEWTATIDRLTKSHTFLSVGEPRDTDTESALRLHLVQGVSRGDRMDVVVQKATELGVKRITPVLTEYGVVKFDDARADKRREHWQRIGESACEQSGRTRPPLIDRPLPLNDWFGSGDVADSTQLVLQPGAPDPLTGVDDIDEKICLLVGPEGGFSDKEYEDAHIAGFSAVSLGPRILRTETAPIVALALLQAKFGDLQAQAAQPPGIVSRRQRS